MFAAKAAKTTRSREQHTANTMKYLIVGLGNIGPESVGSRHNIGFNVADALTASAGASFESCRYGDMARFRVKNAQLIVLKPSTFMNLSGVAVRYWMNKENIQLDHLLVIVDDLALPLGTLRLKPSGSNAGHNGLGNIQSVIGTDRYSRLRVGIGNDFPRGMQIQWVLGRYDEEELQTLAPKMETACEIIRSFVLAGVDFTMNSFNKKK